MNKLLRLLNLVMTIGLISLNAGAGASEPGRCESLLISAIQKMMARKIFSLAVQTLDTGMPLNNPRILEARPLGRVHIQLQRLEIPLTPLPANTVFLQSDLGPSLWTEDQLTEWRNLSTYLVNEEVTLRELMKIADNANYCTAGILPTLCHSLRESRQARRRALRKLVRELNSTDDAIFSDALLRLIRQNIFEHMSRDLIRFPWGSDFRAHPDKLTPDQADKIFRVMIREVLIRHLVFKGLDGGMHLGGELSLDARLALASVPAISQLIPLFLSYPLDLNGYFVVGDTDADLQILNIAWKNSLGWDAPLYVSVGFEPSVTKLVTAHFLTNTDEPTFTTETSLIFQAEVDRELTHLAAEFSKVMGLTGNLKIASRFDSFEFLDVNIKGLSSLQQILFYYYVAEKVPKNLQGF
ncbi:MAG: hypothetical protein ACXVA9_00015 [Bdellovibrionales bacterium]